MKIKGYTLTEIAILTGALLLIPIVEVLAFIREHTGRLHDWHSSEVKQVVTELEAKK